MPFVSTCVVSADMADAMHPSQVCPSGQEETFHQPKLRDGLVLKHDAGNSNDIVTSFLFREVAKRNSIPTQVCSSSLVRLIVVFGGELHGVGLKNLGAFGLNIVSTEGYTVRLISTIEKRS